MFSTGSNYLASCLISFDELGSNDKSISLWDVIRGRLLWRLQGHTEPVVSLAISPNGKLLASGNERS